MVSAMRMSALVLAVALLPLPAAAQLEDSLRDCAHGGGEIQIKACSWLIAHGQQKDSDLAVSFVNRGVAYQQKGDFNKAAFDYTQAMTLMPDYALAYVNMGSLYDADGQYDRAIGFYDKAITAKPEFALGYFARARANAEAGRHEAALADYDAYAARVANDPE